MKRGKDEEKMVSPMFPRLHVNDTKKGGPRAPPRNKMALYEQLSIPSQRHSHLVLSCNPSSSPAMVPSSSQVASERDMFLSYQLPSKYQSENQYGRYSDISIRLTQVEQRKKSDEDDSRVPIFVHSVSNQECGTHSTSPDRETIASEPSCVNGRLKGTLKSSTVQEGKQKKAHSKNSTTGTLDAISSQSSIVMSEGRKKQTDLPAHNPSPNNGIESREPSLCIEARSASERHGATVPEENIIPSDRRNFSTLVADDPMEDKNNFDDLSNDIDSHEERSCRLEWSDSGVTETSGVGSVCRMDITPDDVVGVIGQKRFWKARRVIANQQRNFAIQVFELHRLIKVQQLIAASPHILLEDSAYLGKSATTPPGKRIPLDPPSKEILHVSKQKGESEKPSNKKESAAENTIAKVQNDVSRPSVIPSSDSPARSMNSAPWCFNQPHGQQWLIPVMSPTEGLIYKPYAGPGFVGPACGVPNPAMGNFYPPACGVPPPFPPHPQSVPHGYFPHHTIPLMNPASFSGSSVEQMIAQPDPCYTSMDSMGNPEISIKPSHKNQTSPDALNNLNVSSEAMEVQASTVSSPLDQQRDSRAGSASMDRRNMLPLFPMSPVPDACEVNHQPDNLQHAKVIKVVPHNAQSATESAARIFQSIQEERKRYDSI